MVFNPKISIVIPTYNRAYTLKRTINSILKQTFENYEIIVVDDASTDNTREVIKTIIDKRLKYICLNHNTKGTMPRNVGIEHCRGEYIAFLDSDDEWLPTKLEEQLKFISKIKEKNFLCFTNVIKFDGEKKYKKNQRNLKDTEDIMDYILVDRNIVQTSTFFMPTKLAKKIKFNSKLRKHQDWDFCLRLRDNNTKFYYLNKALTIWYTDSREDRISINQNYEDSLKWFKMTEKSLSLQAQYAFLVRNLVNYFVINKKKYSAFRIIMKAFKINSIDKRTFVRSLGKLIIPMKFWKVKR